MTDNLFWIHRDQIYAKGLDLGFSVFRPGILSGFLRSQYAP